MPPDSSYSYVIMIDVIVIAAASCAFGILAYGLVSGTDGLVFRKPKQLPLLLPLARICFMVSAFAAVMASYYDLVVMFNSRSNLTINAVVYCSLVISLLSIVVFFPISSRQKHRYPALGQPADPAELPDKS